MDATDNVTSDQKVDVLTGWVKQWGEAVQQGAECTLQPNKLVSPLHTEIASRPPDTTVCGYYFPPESTCGDTARLIKRADLGRRPRVPAQPGRQRADVHKFGPNPDGTADAARPGRSRSRWRRARSTGSRRSWARTRTCRSRTTTTSPVVVPAHPRPGRRRRAATHKPDGDLDDRDQRPAFGTVTGAGSPVYAFDTDSAAGLGLATDLLAKGVKVYRAATPFNAAGHRSCPAPRWSTPARWPAGVDLTALAAARETPVWGLPTTRCTRYPLTVPKIGLYTGPATTVPDQPEPRRRGHGRVRRAATARRCSCSRRRTRSRRLLISRSSPTDLSNGRLVSEHFTALINPAVRRSVAQQPATPSRRPRPAILQKFVNQGGRYIGDATNGTTTARNAGITCVNTQTVTGISTPARSMTARSTPRTRWPGATTAAAGSTATSAPTRTTTRRR